MGNTVWILSESNDSDDWDHSYILKHEKLINKLCLELGLKKLSEYFDHSILAGEFGEEAEPTFSNPEELGPLIVSLISAIREGKSKKHKDESELLEELEDCLLKINLAKEKGERVRVSLVP